MFVFFGGVGGICPLSWVEVRPVFKSHVTPHWPSRCCCCTGIVFSCILTWHDRWGIFSNDMLDIGIHALLFLSFYFSKNVHYLGWISSIHWHLDITISVADLALCTLLPSGCDGAICTSQGSSFDICAVSIVSYKPIIKCLYDFYNC